jgi:Ser/Thr protein kinase RdoA (MazF antagonist)
VRQGVGGVDPAHCALARYTSAPDAALEPLGGGLINQTFRFRGPRLDGVLQRLNPIFPPTINEDIDRVTAHLALGGLATPRVLRTLTGARWADLGEGGVWRALSWIPGSTLARADSARTVFEAGSLLGRFHAALADLELQFGFERVVHDTPAHLRTLSAAVESPWDEAVRAHVEPLATDILATADGLPDLPETPSRVLHGDPKLDNVRFDADGRRALCLVDLDTLRRGPLPHDLGDAWRSWCNRAGEDEPVADLDLDYLRAAAEGYASTAVGFVSPAEVEGFAVALRRIAVELAARFCVDAYEDRYFGWNTEMFASRREHNLVRARGQLSLAVAVARRCGEIEAVVQRAFAVRVD